MIEENTNIMARYEDILDGDIRGYYHEYSGDTYLYECVGCERTSEKHFKEINHRKNCRIVKKWIASNKQEAKNEKIRAVALAKLTPKEKKVLGL